MSILSPLPYGAVNSLNNLQSASKSLNRNNASLSAGEVSDYTVNPNSSALGSAAKLKIQDFKNASFQCIEASTLCQNVSQAINNGLNILTDQLQFIINANTDVADPHTKNVLDNSFQSSLSAFQDAMNSVVDNNNLSVLTERYIFPTSSALGIYTKASANNYQLNSFNLGVGTSAVTNLFDVCGTLNGDVQTATFLNNTVTLQIGGSTLTGNVSNIGANNLFTLTDVNAPFNHLTFSVGASDATSITTGINSILGSMSFGANVFNLSSTALFTGGIDYTLSTGNFSGTVQSVDVSTVIVNPAHPVTEYVIDVVIGDGDQAQTFTATITPPPVANTKLQLTSTTNANNKIAFTFGNSIPNVVSQQTMQNNLNSLLSVNSSTPAMFKSPTVPQYSGITIQTDSTVLAGDYQLSYTYNAAQTTGQFTLVDGTGQSYTLNVVFPISNSSVQKFANGVSLLIDTTQFNVTTNKAAMSVDISNKNLYFQTGITSNDQLDVPCPNLSMTKLGLNNLNLKTAANALAASIAVKNAINTLNDEIGKIVKFNEMIQNRQQYNDDQVFFFKNVYDNNMGIDIPTLSTQAVFDETKMDMNFGTIAKNAQWQEKYKKLLDSLM